MSQLLFKEESYDIIGCCMEVHRELGPGFLEAVYHEALAIEFDTRFIPYEHEKELNISYKSIELRKGYFADFMCHEKIILEIKAINEINSVHISQVLNYLKATDLRLGLLVNFGAKKLEYKRIVR